MQDSQCEVAGRYRVGALLSARREVKVHRATDIVTGRNVILKTFSDSPQGRDRFRKESHFYQLCKNVNGVPTVLATSTGADSSFYVLSDSGESLTSIQSSGRTLTLSSLLHLGKSLIEVLESLHTLGILFLGLSPDSVLINAAEASVAVCGFSSAVELTPAQESGASPPSDCPPSHSEFQSTEQIYDQNPTYRSDIESLACLLMFLEVGKLPWSGGSRGEMFLDRRKRVSRSEAFQRASNETRYLWTFAHSLEPGEKPNYSYLKSLFRNSTRAILFEDSKLLPRFCSEDIAHNDFDAGPDEQQQNAPSSALREAYMIPTYSPLFSRRLNREQTIESLAKPSLSSAVRVKLSAYRLK